MKVVLFVCVENSNRSQMAEAFSRLHGNNHLQVYSAGSRPSGKVNPKAIQAMRQKGYDLTEHSSKAFSDLPDRPFDFIVTMGCGDACGHISGRNSEDWALPDPREMPPADFNRVRDEIESPVLDLLGRLDV